MTRLLCARIYLYGALASVPALFNLARPLFHARDPGIGYDKRPVLFHALQSLTLSLLFAVPAALALWGPRPMDGEDYGALGWLSLAIAALKVGVLNPFLARTFFSSRVPQREFRLRGVATVVDALTHRLLPRAETEDANASYFAGGRPFTGYGTEINAWTLVIDTSAAAQSAHDFAGPRPEPAPLSAADLYRAIIRCAAALRVEDLAIGWRTFLKGTLANEQRKFAQRRLVRPPQRLPQLHIGEIDRDGEDGRRYMVLSMEKPGQDLIAAQFVRFQANGKLIFCEFASYVLAPGNGRLSRLDWLFGIQSLVYLLFGALLFVVAVVFATALTFAAAVALPALGLIEDASFFLDAPGLLLQGWIGFAIAPGAALLSLALTVLAFGAAFTAWRVVRGLFSLVGLLAGLSRQFGVAFSYRERFTSRGNLDYYCLQDVARFMKSLEKLLVKSICEQLRLHGIDASDFKESLTAYINQGVINSGDIRGNVLSSVKSFVFRRPARSAVNRSRRKVANA